jgi:hypothetical protein
MFVDPGSAQIDKGSGRTRTLSRMNKTDRFVNEPGQISGVSRAGKVNQQDAFVAMVHISDFGHYMRSSEVELYEFRLCIRQNCILPAAAGKNDDASKKCVKVRPAPSS